MYRPIGNVADLPWVKKIMAAEGDAVWVLAEDEAESSTKYLMLGRVLWNVHDLSKPVGVVTIRIELGRLQSYVMNTSSGQLIYLETDDGEVVISSGQDGMDQGVQPLASFISRDRLEPMTVEDSEYLVRIPALDRVICYFVPSYRPMRLHKLSIRHAIRFWWYTVPFAWHY